MMIGDTVYPTPALESLIPLIVPAALTIAVPIAVLPERGAENVIVGGLSAEYAAPPLETVMIPTPPVVAIPTVTATPVPPPPWNTTEGGTVYRNSRIGQFDSINRTRGAQSRPISCDCNSTRCSSWRRADGDNWGARISITTVKNSDISETTVGECCRSSGSRTDAEQRESLNVSSLYQVVIDLFNIGIQNLILRSEQFTLQSVDISFLKLVERSFMFYKLDFKQSISQWEINQVTFFGSCG